MTMTGLEVPVFSPTSARTALSHGASRIEVNRAGSYPDGGTTPDESEVEAAALSTGSSAPLRIMIRPRGPPPQTTAAGGGGQGGGRVTDVVDFVYSDAEVARMRDDVRRFRDGGHMRADRGDGFVFGVLKRGEGEREGGGPPVVVVDVERNAELVRLARPFPCVFHRAFDLVVVVGDGGEGGAGRFSSAAAEAGLRAVARCGFDGVLTSGGPGPAVDNAEALGRILQLAGDLEVIVGGGVRGSNLRVLRDSLGCHIEGSRGPRVWFHSSCLALQSGDDEIDGEEVERIASGLGGAQV